MELHKYDRKPFSVTAVELSFENLNEVAEWCKGEISTESTKILGTSTMLPVVTIEGLGEARGKTFVARLGYFIVELNGSFRVYKPKQFKDTFERQVPLNCVNADGFVPVSERTEFGDDAA